jgi:hypothetical protein
MMVSYLRQFLASLCRLSSTLVSRICKPLRKGATFSSRMLCFGFFSSISKLETYLVCNFMDLPRSEECRAFYRGSNLWAVKQ